MSEVILAFANTHRAIHCERALMADGIPVKVMSLPSSISKDCGLCVKIKTEYLDRALAVLEAASVQYSGVYRLEEDGGYTLWEE